MVQSLANSSLNKLSLPDKISVVGKGIVKNNLLIEPCLGASIESWYPWHDWYKKINLLTQSKATEATVFAGWGQKKSFERAKSYAHKHHAKQFAHSELPLYSIEDGFLRSIDSGLLSRHAVSLVVDDIGIYFDLTQASRLEQMIIARNHPNSWSNQQDSHSKYLIKKIIANDLSKYNHTLYCPDLDVYCSATHGLPKNNLIEQKPVRSKGNNTNSFSKHVLVIDQVAGDYSISGAGADADTFKRMLKDACRQHPNAKIWVKAHPAANKGYLSTLKLTRSLKERVHWLKEVVNPIKLLKQVDYVYTVSSHMGFEALLLNKNVYCYGVNWYSGWGLTNDDDLITHNNHLYTVVTKRRQQQAVSTADAEATSPAREKVNLEQLFFAAYLDYCHYVDPASKKSCDIETAIDWLILNCRWAMRLRGEINVYEFSRWKKPFVQDFLNFPKTTLAFKSKAKFSFSPQNHDVAKRSKLSKQIPTLVWGLAKKQEVHNLLTQSIKSLVLAKPKLVSKPDFQAVAQTKQKNASIYCMEDGFVRSNGLGATLLAPLSIVLDKRGIYYNATTASDLEVMLQNAPALTEVQQQRVQALHKVLLQNKVSKYNVGRQLNTEDNPWLAEMSQLQKKKLLIIGQVEDDLSIKYCGSIIKTNAELIQRVVKENPDAFLIYKPHPDVEAGLRTGKVSDGVLKTVDAIAHDVSMPDCLAMIDEVHTISSLTGFEALLRGKHVCCYGLPFYSGWGLTEEIDSEKAPKKAFLKRRQSINHSSKANKMTDKKLTLDQLIHYTLIEYSLYRLPNGYGLAQIEQVIDYLYSQSTTDNLDSNKLSILKDTLLKKAKKQGMQLRHQYLNKP